MEDRIRPEKIEDFFLKDESSSKGRISNALNINIAAPRQLDLFDNLSEEDRESLIIKDSTGRLIDRKGKSVFLSVEDIQLVKALSSYLPFHSPEIMDYVSLIDTMDANGNMEKKPIGPIQLPISIPKLSKDIIGDTKETSLRKIANRLQNLAEIKQAQTFYVKTDGRTDKYTIYRPLFILSDELYKHYSEIRSTKGRKKEEAEDETKILVWTNIIYSSLFLYKATKEYCPLYTKRLFDVWKRNKTELFAIILSDLESKWRQYYIASIKAETAAKEKYRDLKKDDKGEYYKLVAAAKKAALIYDPKTISIRNRITTDYETKRAYRARFIPDLQRAINSLVEYGIITNDSRITNDKEKVLFCYNPDFYKGVEFLLPNTEN